MPDAQAPRDPVRSVPLSRSLWLTLLVLWGLVVAGTFAWGIAASHRTSYRATLVPSAPLARGLASLDLRVEATGPLADARVEVLSEQTPGSYVLAANGATSTDGTLHLTELPSGPAFVLVRSPGLTRVVRRVVLFGSQPLLLTLEPEHRLVVSVEDEQGEPIAGATVLVKPFVASAAPTTEPVDVDMSAGQPALPPEGAEPVPFGYVTDEHGVARLTGLGAPPFALSVFAKGYSTARRDNVTTDMEVTLTQLGALTVSVLGPTGDPVPNAEVQLVGTRVWPAKRAQSDAQGRVILGSLPEGLYDLRALAGRLVSPIVANVRLERGERRQIEVRMVEGRMVGVQVTTAEEPAEPIARAKLVLAEHGLSAFPLAAVADEQGRANLGPVPPGPSFLSVRAEGFIARGAVSVPESGPVVVKLLRGGAVHGEIEDVDGRPIRDARIEVVGLDLDGLPIAESPLSSAYRDAHFEFSLRPIAWAPAGELGVTFGPVPFVSMVTENPTPNVDFTALPADYSPWVSDGDGHFRASPVPPGRIRLIVRHNAFAEGQSRIFTMGPGGNVHVKVVLDVGHTLRGRVVDENDRPVAAARVLVSGVHNGFERGLASEKDGTFELRGVPSEVNVSLARPDDPTRFVKRQKLALDKGNSDEVEFVLPGERDALSWTVYDDQNATVELAQVSVQSLDPDVPFRATQFTDEHGRVTIDDAEGLDLRVSVEAPGYIPISVQARKATDDVTLTLTRGVKVKGRVTAVRGRSEVAGARVTLEAGARRDTTTTSSLGEYEFANVAPGKVRLRVNHEDYAVVTRDISVEATGYAERPFEAPDIDLKDAVSVHGSVIDRNGRPVPAARVAATPLSEVRPKGAMDEEVVLTDDAGRFVLTGLAPGEVTLYAQSALAGKGQVRINISESGLDGVVVELGSPLKEEGSDFSPSVGSIALGLGQKAGKLTVTSVPSGGEAERAGIRTGDVVGSIDGVVPKGSGHARTLLSGPLASDVVISVVRGAEEHAFRVRREQTSR